MVNEAPPVTDEELDRQEAAETEAEGLDGCGDCGAIPEIDGGHVPECIYFAGDKQP